MNRSPQSIVIACCSLIAATTVATASPVTLYSTGYEAPEYTTGALSGQQGWVNDFGIDPIVTSDFARTGSQSLEVFQAAGQSRFGLTVRPGPYSTTLPQVTVEHSIYLAGTSGWSPPNTQMSPMALSGSNGFIAQLPIINGQYVEFGTTQFPIVLETWIDLKLTLDFPTQTAHGFVNGTSVGSVPFGSVASELRQVEIFPLFRRDVPGPSNSFFVDDLKIVAIPEPAALSLIGAVGVVALRRRSSAR